jgi:hypothetical protein
MQFDRSRYPDNWKQLSEWIRFVRAAGKCEGSPAYPDCRAEHGKAHPVTGANVLLTTAHLDHDPTNCAHENLRAWCQRCHLTYDAELHARHAASTRYSRKNTAMNPLFPLSTVRDSTRGE